MKKYIISLTLVLLVGCSGSTRPSNDLNKVVEKKKEYVPEVIGGHLLPKMPDEKLNNSTLKGIDSNKNGIRDDVEIFILKQNYRPVVRELVLADAKGFQAILERPTSEAVKIDSEEGKVSSCLWWLWRNGYISEDEYDNRDKPARKKTYNTIERMKKARAHERALSGGVYELEVKYMTKESCKKLGIDVDKLSKEKK